MKYEVLITTIISNYLNEYRRLKSYLHILLQRTKFVIYIPFIDHNLYLSCYSFFYSISILIIGFMPHLFFVFFGTASFDI